MSEVKNPLLARLQIPGETFRLPSQGLFYRNGELAADVKDGEVHVFPMTAYDEIIFKTPDMLMSGKAVDEVFRRCIPQVLKPRELLSKDVDFLVTCLRVITYGPEITLTYQHNCEGAKSHTYKTSLQDIMRRAKSIDPTTLADVYTVVLENGQCVKMRPTVFSAMLALNQQLDTDEELSMLDIQSRVMLVLVDMIESIDGITDRAMIREWIDAVPAGWVKFLRDAIERVSDWGVEFRADAVCKDCGAPISMPFTANPVSFFS